MDVRGLLLGFCVIVFTGVTAVMLVLSWRHHRDPAHQEGNFHRSVWTELGWTLTPLLMAGALAWPTVKVFFER